MTSNLNLDPKFQLQKKKNEKNEKAHNPEKALMIQRKSINNNHRSDKQNRYIRLYPHPSYGIHCGS